MPKRRHADGMQVAAQDHPTGGKRFRIKKSSAVEVAEAFERLVPKDKLTAFHFIQKIVARIPGWQPTVEYSEEVPETKANAMEGAPEVDAAENFEEVMKRLAPQFAHVQLSLAQELQERDALAFALTTAKAAGIDEKELSAARQHHRFLEGLEHVPHLTESGAHELKDLMMDCYEKGMCGKCGLDVALRERVNRLIASLELWAARRSRDAGKMVAAVESARRSGLQHPLLQELTVDAEHIQKARRRAKEQKKEEVREQLLERAAQLVPGNKESLANLQHAIDRAERYGVEENLVLGVYRQLKMAKCEQELDEAMQFRSISNLEIAIDQAECWGVARVKVRAAQRVLEEEHHIKEVLNYFRETLRLPGRKQRVLRCYEELCQTQLGRSEEGGCHPAVPVFRG